MAVVNYAEAAFDPADFAVDGRNGLIAVIEFRQLACPLPMVPPLQSNRCRVVTSCRSWPRLVMLKVNMLMTAP